MPRILVIGASGFVGGNLARGLLMAGHPVRCLARQPAQVADLATIGCEVVPGDVTDLGSIRRAMASVRAVYIAIHTLGPQHASTAGQGFMDIELQGMRNIVAACREHGVRRLIVVTSLGITLDGPGAWVRGRWEAEQFLLGSGLDVTIIRPGQIVGMGGLGFGMTVSQARRRVAIVFGSGRARMQNIAIADLVYYLVAVLDDPRAYGQGFDVGADEILTTDRMIDIAADVLGRPHPRKIHVQPQRLRLLAPLIERMTGSPRGAIRGIMDVIGADLTGDPRPIRSLLPRPLLSYRQAVAQALNLNQKEA